MLWAWSKRLFLFFYFAEFVATRVPEPREDGAVWVIPLPPSSCGALRREWYAPEEKETPSGSGRRAISATEGCGD